MRKGMHDNVKVSFYKTIKSEFANQSVIHGDPISPLLTNVLAHIGEDPTMESGGGLQESGRNSKYKLVIAIDSGEMDQLLTSGLGVKIVERKHRTMRGFYPVDSTQENQGEALQFLIGVRTNIHPNSPYVTFALNSLSKQ